MNLYESINSNLKEQTYTIKQTAGNFGTYTLCDWKSTSPEKAVEEFVEQNPEFKDGKKGHITAVLKESIEMNNSTTLNNEQYKNKVLKVVTDLVDVIDLYEKLDTIEKSVKSKYHSKWKNEPLRSNMKGHYYYWITDELTREESKYFEKEKLDDALNQGESYTRKSSYDKAMSKFNTIFDKFIRNIDKFLSDLSKSGIDDKVYKSVERILKPKSYDFDFDSEDFKTQIDSIYKVDKLLRNNLTLKESDDKKCVLCGKHFSGWGNDAWPLADGYCCDDCNMNKVVPARIAQAYKKEEPTDKKEAEYGDGARHYSNALIDLCEQGIVSWENVAHGLINYCSEDDIKDFCDSYQYTDLIDNPTGDDSLEDKEV